MNNTQVALIAGFCIVAALSIVLYLIR